MGKLISAASEITPPNFCFLYNFKILSSSGNSDRKNNNINTPKLVHNNPANSPQKKYLLFTNSIFSVSESYCDQLNQIL